MKNEFFPHKNFNYIQYTEPNIFNRRNYFLQNHKKQNIIKNNTKNLNRFRSATKINNNIKVHKENFINKNKFYAKEDLFDIRLYFCLKMLGLTYLQNIFEKNKINFDELLILSIKDLDMLQIIKKDQIKIKKFSLDYIKNASYYSIEELENYFINKKNINKYRKAESVGNLRTNKMNLNYKINNNNKYNNPVNNYQYNSEFYVNNEQQEKFNCFSNYKNIYDKNKNKKNVYDNNYNKPNNYNYMNNNNKMYF